MDLKNYVPKKVVLDIHKFINCINLKNKKEIDAVFVKQYEKGLDQIPVFIISYNRLSYLTETIAALEKCGISNIHIIDNNSSYPPLLEFYDNCKYDVIRLKENGGHLVFWKNPIFDKYRNDFYIVTDPDIVPIDECPKDFIERMFNVLRRYPFVKKVGFSLKLEDIPSNSIFSSEAVNWEKKYYKTYDRKIDAYYAIIDTTFALYLPDCISGNIPFLRAFRLGPPYQAKHLPWYKKQGEITEEDVYYSNHKTNGWWNLAEGKVTPD